METAVNVDSVDDRHLEGHPAESPAKVSQHIELLGFGEAIHPQSFTLTSSGHGFLASSCICRTILLVWQAGPHLSAKYGGCIMGHFGSLDLLMACSRGSVVEIVIVVVVVDVNVIVKSCPLPETCQESCHWPINCPPAALSTKGSSSLFRQFFTVWRAPEAFTVIQI